MIKAICLIGLAWPLASLADARHNLLSALNQWSGLRADFHVQYPAIQQEVSAADGQVILSVGQGFRWHQISPSEQWSVSNLKTTWQYDVDLEQVTIYRWQQLASQSPIAWLLERKKNALLDFDIQQVVSADDQQFVLRPKAQDSLLQEIRVILNLNGLPTSIALVNAEQQITRIVFKHLEKNPRLAKSLFELHWPADTEIIDTRTNHQAS